MFAIAFAKSLRRLRVGLAEMVPLPEAYILGVVFCDQPAVAMWIGTRFACGKFTLLSGFGSASRTTNS
jgi:hypothetical protein